MADYGAFKFASPAKYGDWATYAGFDRVTGDINKSPVVSGIQPPEATASGQSFGQQIMGSVAPNLQKYGSAMDQFGQGNISGAANTMGLKTPSSIALKLPSLGQPVNTGMNSQFED